MATPRGSFLRRASSSRAGLIRLAAGRPWRLLRKALRAAASVTGRPRSDSSYVGAHTARKTSISTGQKPLVSTSFSTGTASSVLKCMQFSTGHYTWQYSTGQKSKPVLNNFLRKKIGCFSTPHPFFLLSRFSFHNLHLSPLCSSSPLQRTEKNKERELRAGKEKREVGKASVGLHHSKPKLQSPKITKKLYNSKHSTEKDYSTFY